MDILNVYIYRMLRNTATYSLAAAFVICLPFGCASQSDVKTDKQKISIEKIPICYAYGCEIKQIVKLGSAEWISVRSVFYPEVNTAKEERKQIAKAIGFIERLVGPKTGTNHDKPGGLAGLMSPSRGQMDCIDEATNTHTYLALLIQDGLILRHKLESNANRIMPYG